MGYRKEFIAEVIRVIWVILVCYRMYVCKLYRIFMYIG